MTIFEEEGEVIDVDVDGPLDLTGDADVDSWRGVAAEDVEEPGRGLSGLLRSRSRRLLGVLLAPHKRPLALAGLLIVVNTLMQLLGPWLVKEAIDSGIPPLLDGGDGSIRPLALCVAGFLVVTVVAATSFNGFLVISGRVGQDVLLDLRRRVFIHFQGLSSSFHERYTSGRVISRQTSDVEAIAQMMSHGAIVLISSLLLI